VNQWFENPVHRAILSDGSYGSIGCAEAVVGGTHWFAYVLAGGPFPISGESASESGTMLLPDTSMQIIGDRMPKEARRRFVPR
jgi:hypothetical protein